MIALLAAVCLLLWGYLIGKAKPGINIVKLAVFAVCGFFSLYIVVSALFFWADAFGFLRVLGTSLAAELGAALYLLRREAAAGKGETQCVRGRAAGSGILRRLLPEVSFDMRRYAAPLLIMALALPFTWNKFELYSMGQDQGTYQVKALALLAYDTHNYMEMEEFTKLETPEERQKYLDFVYSQNNLYLPRVIGETETDASRFTNIVGTIHGLPTYSALLALWGAIFGYAQMIGVQTPLYLCGLFLLYFVCENLRLKKGVSAFAALMLAASPIVLWLSKSSLTETGLVLLVCMFLYFLTGEGRKWRCMLPIIVFSFYHISLYAFIPIFLIVLTVMYGKRRDKDFLTAIAGSAAGYGAGALWAFTIAPYYSYGNYNELSRVTGGLLGEKTLIPLIVCVCMAVIALSFLLRCARVENALFAAAGRLAEKKEKLVSASCVLIRLFLAGSLLFFIDQGILKGGTATACEYLQISVYIYMSGLLLVPMIYLVLFFKPRRLLENELTVSLVLLFLYCVVMYSMVMRVRILYYYYFARYAALFLPVIYLLGAYLLEQMDIRAAAALSFLMFLSFVPYDRGLAVQKDHSRCEWEFLADICEYIGPGDAFIAGPEEQQIVFIFPVKLLTGCDVYYADEALGEQLAKLAQRYEHVYYMDYDTAFEEMPDMERDLRGLSVNKAYTNWNHLSYLDYFHISNPLTPIPLNYVEYRLKLSLYEIAREVEE